MDNDKAYQKNQLIMEFGILISPFEELANVKPSPKIGEYRKAIAKVQGGDSQWRNHVKRFTKFADDLIFRNEEQDISHVPERFWTYAKNLIPTSNMENDLDTLQCQFKQGLENTKARFNELINVIPIEWPSQIFKANTPFTTYLCIHDCIVSARNRLHYFDPYLNEDFFHLYLRNLDRSVSITLVTTQGKDNYGVKSVKSVSDIFRQEFTNYKLIQVNPKEIHDRNLRIDDQIFIIGTGTNRAGIKPTNFGIIDSCQENHQELDNIIVNGDVIHQS